MFLKVRLTDSNSTRLFLWNLPIDGECSTEHFNSFTCSFINFNFDNLKHPLLIKLFRDGRFVSPFLEHWLEQNTNLQLLSGNRTNDFVNSEGSFYQLKTFTKYGLNFRPSFQKGSQRIFNQESFELYCKSQLFIIASIVDFPIVRFRVFKGATLLKRYKLGRVPVKMHNSLFPVVSTNSLTQFYA